MYKVSSLMNNIDLEALCNAISENHPLVLFLGQRASLNENNSDPVLLSALKRSERFNSDEGEGKGFESLLAKEPLDEDFYGWLAETYNKNLKPEEMSVVASLPLNAVFTTAIDPSLPRVFRINGRDVETILSKEDNPSFPRDRQNLHLTYIFGSAGEPQANEAPPLDKQQYMIRKAIHGGALLSRLVDTTTPLGVLLIDGFILGQDWLSEDDLYGILSVFGKSQVYWFNWQDEQIEHKFPLIYELSKTGGPIVPVKSRLATVLKKLELEHRIDLSPDQGFSSNNSLTIGENSMELSPSIRLKTSTAASIIDDTWLAPLNPIGPESEYLEFQRFHGHVETTKKIVEGIRRKFTFKRSFEAGLNERVCKALENAGRSHEIILIHGQSGSGKSLALARLAYEVRTTKKYPVLLAARASRLPAVDELDEFCLRAEEAGASATLLICDANTSVTRYRDLLRGFLSRGRKVVIVGSTYRIVDGHEDTSSNGLNLFEVTATLDPTELGELNILLGRVARTTFQVENSEYLLPAIYHLLPHVRPHLASGLAKEARVTEESLRVRGQKKGEGLPESKGQLAQALIDAGLLNPKNLIEDKLEEFLGAMTDTASRAIDYVMVPGKLGCQVPVSLLMRAIGGNNNQVDVYSLFKGIDLFRWSRDDRDDIFVHPRLQVEAELLCARRLGTSQAEAKIAIDLIENSNPSSHESSERRFILDLVHKLGPDGRYGKRFASSYLDIARALTNMRVNRGVIDPSLMLQEATLRRRAFRDSTDELNVDSAAVLEEAIESVDTALEHFGDERSPGIRIMCARLKVERAAIYGFRAVQRLRDDAPQKEVWQYYEAARESARAAASTADTYFISDISVWIPNDLLRDGNWDFQERAELIADIWDGLEQVDTVQLDSDQYKQYEERRYKVGQTLKNNELKQDALNALEAQGSKAWLFLKAREIGGALTKYRDNLEPVGLEKAEKVVSFLNNYRVEIREDARCLRYSLKAFWCLFTNTYLFGQEKSPLPAKNQEKQNCLEIVELLRGIEGELGDPRMQYLQAVLLWVLSREESALEIWGELSQNTAYNDPRRVIRHHLWTAEDGKPRLFHGRVISEESGRGRFKVRVDDIRQNVELLQRDFPTINLRRNAAIAGGFHIAFNFIGPIAEPLTRGGVGR